MTGSFDLPGSLALADARRAAVAPSGSLGDDVGTDDALLAPTLVANFVDPGVDAAVEGEGRGEAPGRSPAHSAARRRRGGVTPRVTPQSLRMDSSYSLETSLVQRKEMWGVSFAICCEEAPIINPRVRVVG